MTHIRHGPITTSNLFERVTTHQHKMSSLQVIVTQWRENAGILWTVHKILEIISHSYSNKPLKLVSKINMLIKGFESKTQIQIRIPMNTWYFIKKPEIYDGKLKSSLTNGASLTRFRCGEESRQRHICQPEQNSDPTDSKASPKTICTEPDRRETRE